MGNRLLAYPTEISSLMVPVLPASQIWEEWLRQHSNGGLKPAGRKFGRHGNSAFTGQLSIWGEE